MSIVTSVPLPIDGVPVDGSAQLALDQGADDLRAEAPPDLTLGQTRRRCRARGPRGSRRARSAIDLDIALLPGEAVLDGVRDELGEGERQRRRVLARQRAERPVDRVRARVFGAAATSATSLSTRSNTSSKSTFCARPSESVSCTTAIADTRRMAWVSASRASSECVRRAWMRSSDATVCRLFFTR